MKKRSRLIALLVMLMAIPELAQAQFATPTDNFNNNGTRVAQFLKIPVGGRATAMGESYAAVANDATALFWNPGGIGNLDNLEVHFTHVEYLLDIKFEYAGLVVPVGSSRLGFSAAVLGGVGDNLVTTLSDPDGASGTTWSANSFAIGFTYSRALSNKFSVGLTGKYIQEGLYNSSANTLAFDIGSLYNTGVRGIKIGMAMTNFGGKMQLSGRDFSVRNVDADPNVGGNFTPNGDLRTEEWPIPLNFRVGLSLDLVRNDQHAVLVVSDFNHPTDAKERIHFGAEYSYTDRLYLRGGYKFNYDEQSFTAGGGLNLPITNYNLLLDYAYQDFGILGNTHRFSFGFRL